MFKIRKFVPVGVLRLLHFSFVRCHSQYCAISWGSIKNSVLQRLSVLQNNILLMTFSKCRCHITPLYKNVKILKVHDIYQFDLAKVVQEFRHGQLTKIDNEFFEHVSSVHSYQARFASMENYCTLKTCFKQCWKINFLQEAVFWAYVEESLNAVPLSDFCRKLQDIVLSLY